MASLKQCFLINSLYCNPIFNLITSFILATRWQEHANSNTVFKHRLSPVHSVKEIHLAETQKTESNLESPISGEVAKSMQADENILSANLPSQEMKKYQYFDLKWSVQAPLTPLRSTNMIQSKIRPSIFFFFFFFFNDNLPPLFFGHRFPVIPKTCIFSDHKMNKPKIKKSPTLY